MNDKQTNEAGPTPAERLLQNAEDVNLQAESLLHVLADEPDLPGYSLQIDPAVAVVLRLAGIDPNDRNAMLRQIGRVRAEKEQRRIWKGSAALAAATAERDQAAKLEAERREVLQQQINALQSELQELGAATVTAQKVVDRMNAARERLRELVPPFIENRASHARNRARYSSTGTAVRDIDERLRQVDRAIEDCEAKRSGVQNGVQFDLELQRLKHDQRRIRTDHVALQQKLNDAMRTASRDVERFVERGLEALGAPTPQ